MDSKIEKKDIQHDMITSGPISKTILNLAVPVTLAMFMEFALTSTDYFWVGKLGSTAQDAVTSSMVVVWMIFVLISIVTVGVTALVSRNVGSKNYSKAAYYVKQGMGMSLFISITLCIIGWFVTPLLLKFMGSGENTMLLAVPYLRISFFAGILFFWDDTAFAAFRSSGDTKTPTIISITAVIINMIHEKHQPVHTFVKYLLFHSHILPHLYYYIISEL